MRLILAEKPKVAQKIAFFLSDGKAKRKAYKKVSYYEFNDTIVAPAVGHIFTVAQKGNEKNYPVLDIEWVPSYKINKKSYFTKNYVDLLNKIKNNIDEFIAACDYDIEGSLIGYNVYRFIFNGVNVKRMKFSAITPKDIKNAYENLQEMDYGNAWAGETRHILDWLYGINLSRALMSSLRRAHLYKILSIGRVQGPTLAILAEREIEIKNFIPKPYWELLAIGKEIEFKHKKNNFFDENEAKKSYNNTKDTGKIIKIEKKEKEIYPLPPFDLTSLQIEAFAQFRFSPSKTLKIAQSLYENSYISYPRTSSQKLPFSINFRRILGKLKDIKEYKKYAEELLEKEKLIPRQGKKEDLAHPAIHPTGIYGEMDKDEKKLYDLIVRRFLSVFKENAIKEINTVVLESNNEIYEAKGSRIIKKGWIEIYKYYKDKDVLLPEFKENEEVKIKKKIKEKKTKPPKRFTQASIVSELEKRHLGTKTTRSMIVDILYSRNYIEGKPIKVTDFGLAIYKTLKKYSPRILDENMTRKIEEDIDKIIIGEKKKETVIEEGKNILIKILNHFKENEENIGKELAIALKKTDDEQNIVGKCPKCGGNLKIIKLKNSRFIGCSNYPNCKNAFPLPHKGLIKPTKKICKECGNPIIKVINGKKRYEMCINPNCPSKEKWKKS